MGVGVALDLSLPLDLSIYRVLGCSDDGYEQLANQFKHTII